MVELPRDFISAMREQLNTQADEFFSSYNRPAEKGIRINTLKISCQDFARISPFETERVPWETNGFYINDEKPGKNVLHAAGLYYVQEPSAMCAAPLLNVQSGERVLDLCSAPGGKGTQLAQNMNGGGIIITNEINFSRAKILSQNIERFGVKNAVVTCADPHTLSKIFVGWFDKILVDAPCSGEGMFKKEPNAIPEWSVENVKMCAERQAEILSCAQSMLKVGGKMVYSTCTFSREEDEGQIENFLSRYPDFKLLKTDKLYPHRVRGEGHFAALLQKMDGEEGEELPLFKPLVKDKTALKAYREFEANALKTKFENIHQINSNLYALPDGMPVLNVQTLRAGVHLGEITGGRFQPSHSLAMCLKRDEVNCIEVDEATAIKYLSGLTFDCSENVNGWFAVTYKGYHIGWCKCVNGVAKNHLPKGLRINT